MEEKNGQPNAAQQNGSRNDKQTQANQERATAPIKRPLRMRETVRIINGAPVFAPGGNAKGSEQILQVVNETLTAPLPASPAADQGSAPTVKTESPKEATPTTGNRQALDKPLIEPARAETAQADTAQLTVAWPKSRKKRAAELEYRNFAGTAPSDARDEQQQGQQNNSANHRQERGQERAEPASVRPFPPAKPSQRIRTQQATAKLDYYKKLAELQQLNAEAGRPTRTANEHPLTAPFPALPKPEPPPSPKVEMLPAPPPAPPLEARPEPRNVTPQPVPTTKAEARSTPQPQPVRQPRPEQPPQPRATAKLDFNRYVEVQRRLDDVVGDNGLTIEDRLAARLIEPSRPRLPQRITPASQEVPARSKGSRAKQETEYLPEPQARTQAESPADSGSLDRYNRATKVSRPTPESGLSDQRFKSERPREVLLDPTRIDPHLISLSDFNPRAAKYFDQVAVSLISISYKRLCKRVLIASAQHGEGRSCVALNLAGALARARQRVLIVDCDLLKPSVLRLLGIDSPLGLSEAVLRGLAPNAVTVRVQPAGFNLMPTREPISQSAELLASPRFHEMLQAAEPDYDFILFDSPPLLESRDANLLVGLTDGTMLVIRPGLTTTAQMAKAVSLFNEKDICGVVLNRVAD